MSEKVVVDARKAALKEIDDAKFGWQHVRACLVAGTGFFMDAYDIFAINFASKMISYVYYNGNIPANIDMGLKVSVAVGTLIGQLVFGWLADILGRKKMYGIELMIIIIAALGSAICGEGKAGSVSVVSVIIFWRVIMGLGIGGDYPLSAIITSEFATKKRRGAMMSAVFAMQGFGILAAAIVALVVLASFRGPIIDNLDYIDYCWRLVLGLGAVPGVIALYFRLTIPETPRFTMDVEQNLGKATKDINQYLQGNEISDNDKATAADDVVVPKASWTDFWNYFGKWKNGKILLGTSMSWLTLDIAFYGIGLNNAIILEAIGYSSHNTPSINDHYAVFESLRQMAVGNIIITIMGTVPGYWFTVAFIDKWGRKPIQLMGFTILTVIFIIMGAAYYPLKANVGAFIFLFTALQFFQNFGPNTTTFVVPGEVFPTRYRSTGHGISAASGKLGAIIAQVGFSNLKDIGGKDMFIDRLLLIFAAWMFVGLLFTFLIPETKGLSLEELSNEERPANDKEEEKEKAEG